MSECARSGCKRIGPDKFLHCCELCLGTPGGPHTAACNRVNFPEIRGAELLDDPNAAMILVERMGKALHLCRVLEDELRYINEAGARFIPGYRGNLESLTVHLHVDLHYIAAEIQRQLT